LPLLILNAWSSAAQGHLRKLVAEYVEHYHLERNHQGLGNKLIVPASINARGPVVADGALDRGHR
jgi:hypothetical protein